MTLDQVLGTVEGSADCDWHKMQSQTVYGWEWGQKQGQNYLEPKTHSKLLMYKPDIDISLAMDATVNDPFDEPWVQAFSDPRAVSVAVQLRFRGAIVYEWVFVVVDGGRYLLPMPHVTAAGRYEVPLAKMPLARLFFLLYGVGGPHQDADAALAHAGVDII
jgi:hypothetical protein